MNTTEPLVATISGFGFAVAKLLSVPTNKNEHAFAPTNNESVYERFPALGACCTFPRAWRLLRVFTRLGPVVSLPLEFLARILKSDRNKSRIERHSKLKCSWLKVFSSAKEISLMAKM